MIVGGHAGGRRGAAVLGSPIAHSLSPVLHRAAYDALGRSDWSYRAVECDEQRLGEMLRDLEAEGLAGVSLTMPLKRAVMPMLARAERVATEVGAANTVLFGGVDGEWWGANTDVPGMQQALRKGGVERLDAVTILGGGATAASALAAAAGLGARAATLVVRRPDAAGETAQVGIRLGVAVDVQNWAAAGSALTASVVISTTPAGATDTLVEAVPAQPGLLFDVVYAPWPTRLAARWQRQGGAVVGGLALLVEQAAEQVRLMTGEDPPVDAMYAAGHAALARPQAR